MSLSRVKEWDLKEELAPLSTLENLAKSEDKDSYKKWVLLEEML